MKIGTMLEDILESFFKKNSTQLYPFEETLPPERFRGNLRYSPATCNGCGLCVKDCPSAAIELVTLDRAAKRFVLKYHMDRCVYCGQCAINCRFKCIEMDHADWEHASLDRREFAVYYGNESDLSQFLGSLASPQVEPVGP